MHYYESHMGGVYTSDEYLDYDRLYCDECGDSDWHIGDFDTFEEFLAAYANDISYYGSGGYTIESLIEDIQPDFDYNKALEIVKNNKKGVFVDRYEFFDKLMNGICPEHCKNCPFNIEDSYSCKIDNLLDEIAETGRVVC